MASVTVDAERYRHRGGWYVVGLLTVLYIFSLIDRIAFALLADPISRNLGLSDVQMGLILGMGFAIVYALAGLPLAHFLDTRPRKAIIVTGVVLWGSMTIAAAFAHDFWTLLACRAGLAFGEAVLTPAAVSMIADLFPRERRAWPMSVYASMGGIFATGAFTVGAIVLRFATPLAPALGLQPWQLTLVMLAVPTISLVLLFMLTVKEPVRQAVSEATTPVDAAGFARYLRERAAFFLPFYLGISLITIFSHGLISWMATILLRDHGYDASTSGFSFGLLGMVGGGVGTLVIPQISARIERSLPTRGIPLTFIAISAALVPAAVLLPTSPHVYALLACGLLTVMLSSSSMVLASLVFQLYAESRMRARLMAIYLLATSLVGMALGPSLMVFAASFFPADGRPLAHGMAVVGLGTTPLSVICFIFAYRGVRTLKAVVD